jgi:4,5-DOPA dioxygenase extradiol
MKRKTFLQTLAVLPIIGTSMKLSDLGRLTAPLNKTSKMPVLFMGHGSPMNAIEENDFVKGWRIMGENIPKPTAILCISAHWETRGTWVTAMEQPKTIHDFGGFPKALFDVQYPAKGSLEYAKETQKVVTKTQIGLDTDHWGLDHGCWSVVKHLYPNADVPVFQMSIDHYATPQYHYDLAKELAILRTKGVLIVGSGNMVHNLGLVAWQKMNEPNYSFDWAKEASDTMKKHILDDNHAPLINFRSQGRAFDLAIPTPEHYLPMIYTLALKEKNEELQIFNDVAVAGALTMTSFKIQ